MRVLCELHFKAYVHFEASRVFCENFFNRKYIVYYAIMQNKLIAWLVCQTTKLCSLFNFQANFTVLVHKRHLHC